MFPPLAVQKVVAQAYSSPFSELALASGTRTWRGRAGWVYPLSECWYVAIGEPIEQVGGMGGEPLLSPLVEYRVAS